MEIKKMQNLNLKMFYQTQTARRMPKGRKNAIFLSVVTLTSDIQTRPSKGLNMSSLWIWHKIRSRFRRYFIHKQMSQTAPKAEPYAVHCTRQWKPT